MCRTVLYEKPNPAKTETSGVPNVCPSHRLASTQILRGQQKTGAELMVEALHVHCSAWREWMSFVIACFLLL